MENSLVFQWLGLCAFTAKDPGSIPVWETKISQPAQCGQNFFSFLIHSNRAKEKSVLKKTNKQTKTERTTSSAQDSTGPILPASLHQV